MIVLLAIGFVLLVILSPYRLQRVVSYLNPWSDPFGAGYQLSHALIALGSGEAIAMLLGGVVVKIGDRVYDAVLDQVVTITPTSTVTLAQAAGAPLVVDFSTVTETQTIQLHAAWTLLDGLTWEDGAPVTTADILFAWDAAAAPETPSSKYLHQRTAAFSAQDDQTY